MKQEYILCAAIHYPNENTQVALPVNLCQGVVVCGHRHDRCIAVYSALTGKKTGGNNPQGFLTNRNRFVDRVEGRQIALAAGQITEDTYHAEDLFSEDLY